MANRVLFYGEFPPYTHTGISISNQNILDILSENNYIIDKVEERSWNLHGLRKIIHAFKNFIRVFSFLSKKEFNFFYFNLPLSLSAQIKIIPILILIRLVSRNSKVIAHLHRGDFLNYIQESYLKRKLTSLYLNRIDKLIVLSKKFAKEIKLFEDKIDLVILHNTSEFEGSRTTKSQKYSGKFVCITNYIESKGIRELFNVFNSEDFKHLKLSVYGAVYDSHLYNSLIKTCPENIKINGPLEHKNIQEILLANDCLILPSWNEGQPIIILEAMSIGLAVVATKVGDIPNMLGADYPYLCKPKDEVSLKNSINVFNLDFNKSEVSSYLKKKYQQEFSNEELKQNVLAIFKLL